MADTPAATPAENPQPANTPQPNYAARSALRIMRKAERSLSPWARRALQSSQPGVVQRSPESDSSGGGSLFNSARRPMALTSQTNMGLFNKAQRVSDQAGVIQLRPLARSGAGLVQLSSQISGHFPDIARKYESRPQPGTESIQRSELSLSSNASSGAPESVSASPSLPDLGGNDSEPSITFSPETSLTGIMASRLQAFRDAGKTGAPTGDIQSSSPRQISRMAADVAARATRTDKVAMRRGSVEEIGAKSEAPASEPTEPKTVINESVQRKPAAPSAPSRPAPSAKAAPTQSYSEPAWMAQPDPYDIPDRPELPSITQELAQRYIAQRSADRALPKSPAADDGLPSFLRKDNSGTPAFHLTARNAPQSGPDVQRKPEPSAPARPTPPATPSVDRPLVTPRPTVQRSEATPPASTEPAPSDSDPEPPAAAAAAPSIQRTTSSERPASPKPATPSLQRKAVVGRRTQPKAAPATSRPAPVQRSVGPSQATIQRKPSESSASTQPLDQPLVNRATPASTPDVSSPTPSVQRSVDSAPSTPQSPAPEKPQASVVSPAAPSIQRSPDPTPSVAPKPRESVATDLPLQRKPASASAPVSTPSIATPSEPSVESPTESATPTVQRQTPPNVGPTPSTPNIQRQAAASTSEPSAARAVSPAPESPRPSAPSTPINQAPSAPPSVQRQAADLPLRAQPTPPSQPQSEAPSAVQPSSPSLGQSVVQRAQASSNLPLSQPLPTVQRRVESAAPQTDLPTPRRADASPSGNFTASAPTPTIQRAAEPDVPAGPFNAPLVSPVRTAGTVQRQLDAPVTPLTLAVADHTPDSFTSAQSTATASTIQRSVETGSLAEPLMSMPSLPLVAQRAPASVQREVTTSDNSTETSTSSETPRAVTPSLGSQELQELARRIYPLLKRMLAIERERR